MFFRGCGYPDNSQNENKVDWRYDFLKKTSNVFLLLPQCHLSQSVYVI